MNKEQQLFHARHRVFGANDIFLGNGLTEVDQVSAWGTTIKNKYGMLYFDGLLILP